MNSMCIFLNCSIYLRRSQKEMERKQLFSFYSISNLLLKLKASSDESGRRKDKTLDEKHKKQSQKSVKAKGPFPLRAWKRAFFVCFIDIFLRSLQF